MDDYSRADLVAYCEKLKKKLTRYEVRFSALVDAYKHLVEEKKVLETTLETLNSGVPSKICDSQSEVDDKVNSAKDPLDAVSLNDSTRSDEASDETVKSDDEKLSNKFDLVSSLEEKIAALSTALQSLTAGKTKMEAAFQADKKGMLQEHKQMITMCDEEKDDLHKQLQELKSKLHTEQIDRESEEKIHSSMLKEIQQILSMERLEKDELKSQLLDKRENISLETQKNIEDYENIISQLREELSSVKSELDAALKENKKPVDMMKDLTVHVEKIKLEHANILSVEQKRANYAEEILKSRQQQEEQRIVELESRLTELSDIVGTYDKQRQTDQEVIKKLREKLENMDVANSVFTVNQGTFTTQDSKISELQDQTSKLKSLLKMTWKKADKNIDMFLSNSEIDDLLKNDPIHAACQNEYKQLKDEFENYKRQQKFVKKHELDNQTTDKIAEFEKKNAKLNEEIKYMDKQYAEKERQSLSLVSKLQIDITQIQEHHEKQLEHLNEEHQKSLADLENELHKQRNRTVDLLHEKDQEIDRLQKIVFDREDLDLKQKHERTLSERSFNLLDHEDPAVSAEILIQSPTHSGQGLFHYTQQLTHYETELSLCRSQIADLETDVRDAEHREQQFLEQMQAVKDELRKVERGKSRESANLEYLKNVCLQFMLTDSKSVKKQMSLAIATILAFGPAEIEQLKKKQLNQWW